MTLEDLPIQTVKITGTPGNGYWSQIHTFTPELPSEIEKRGTLLAAITVATDRQGVDAVSYGRDILGRLHEEYFGDKEATAFVCLKRAIERVIVESPDSRMAVAVILGKKIILAVTAKSTIWLKRGDQFGQILTSTGEVEILTGELVKDDLYLLSSEVFNQVVPIGTLRAALEGDINQAGEVISPIILGHEQSGGAVGLIFRVNENLGRLETTDIEKVSPTMPESRNLEEPTETLASVPPQNLYLKRVRLRRLMKRWLPVLAVGLGLLLVVVGVGRVIGKVKSGKNQSREKVLVAETMNKVNEAEKKVAGDPTGLGGLVDEIKTGLEAIDRLKLPETEEYRQLKTKADDLISRIEQIGFIGEPKVYMDLALVGEGIEGKGLVLLGNSLAVLSKDGNKLVVFDVEKKSYQAKALAGDFFGVAGDGEAIFLIGSDGIYRTTVDGGAVKEVVSEHPWGQADRLVYYLGNLYVLDLSKSAIWRFPAVEGGYGKGKDWFKEEVDLKSSVDFAVDGYVWVLDKERIRKFNLGKEEDFNVSSNGFELTGGSLINAAADRDELLVLDGSNGRLLRVSKEGALMKSYQSADFRGTVGLASDGKKAYLLDGKQIYEIELN